MLWVVTTDESRPLCRYSGYVPAGVMRQRREIYFPEEAYGLHEACRANALHGDHHACGPDLEASTRRHPSSSGCIGLLSLGTMAAPRSDCFVGMLSIELYVSVIIARRQGDILEVDPCRTFV